MPWHGFIEGPIVTDAVWFGYGQDEIIELILRDCHAMFEQYNSFFPAKKEFR
jgi:hypothetical protein